MKTISKETTFVIRDKDDSKVILGKVPATVTVEVPTEEDIAEWFGRMDDTGLDGQYVNHRANVLQLLGSQLLQHQGSSATKALAAKVVAAKSPEEKSKASETLAGFTYAHDWAKAPGTRSSEGREARIQQLMKLLGLSREQAEKALAVSQGKAVTEEEDGE